MPHMDTLWMDYGSGNALQVWAVETAGYNDSVVAIYKEGHAVSFPFFTVSTNEFLLDSFPISYTPWLYVICPDRSLRHVEYENIRDYVDNCITAKVAKRNNTTLSLYYSGSSIFLNSVQEDRGKWTMKIYNIRGDLLFDKSILIDHSNHIIPVNLEPGIYIIELSDSRAKNRIYKKISSC